MEHTRVRTNRNTTCENLASAIKLRESHETETVRDGVDLVELLRGMVEEICGAEMLLFRVRCKSRIYFIEERNLNSPLQTDGVRAGRMQCDTSLSCQVHHVTAPFGNISSF